jgi:Holliday junction resolvase RusA-like endonuclease
MKYLTDQEQKDVTNSNVVHFRIEGNPISLNRPRFSLGKVYDSQKQEKLLIGLILKSQMNQVSSFVGNISMDITFYFPISRAVSHKKKMLLRGGFRSSRPDLSNCIKFYEDIMQDVGIYKDDAQIVEITAKKLYDDGAGPRVEITLREINNGSKENTEKL